MYWDLSEELIHSLLATNDVHVHDVTMLPGIEV